MKRSIDIPPCAEEKEYREYSAQLRRSRARELLKPKRRRDNDLLDEIDSTLLYCRKRLDEIAPASRNRRQGRLRFSRIAAVAAVIALLLAVSTVSYAVGRKLLSKDVQWSVRHYYFEDDGRMHTYEEVLRGSVDLFRDELNHHNFDSEDELKEVFEDGLCLPGSLHAVYFVSAEAWGESGNALIRCEYRVNHKPLILEIDVFDREGEGIYSETHLNYPKDFDLYNQNGNLIVGKGPESCFVYFDIGRAHYIMTGGQDPEVIKDIAQKMIVSGRRK